MSLSPAEIMPPAPMSKVLAKRPMLITLRAGVMALKPAVSPVEA